MSDVLVLNAGYEPLHRVSLQKAIRMIVREVAVVEEAIDGERYGDFPMPLVLRLVRYVKMHWRKPMPEWSRKRLFKRDSFICAYCGGHANTIDHVHPKCRGGKNTWDNTVSSCFKCNSKKGRRTLKESGMKLRYQPYTPTWAQINM